MPIAQGVFNISREEILEIVTEEQILQHYFNITRIPCVTHSPLREDLHPSFGLYYSTNGVDFKDYSTGEEGSLVDLLKLYFNSNYHDVLNRLYSDREAIKKHPTITNHLKYNKDLNNEVKKRIVATKDIKVKIRALEKYDIEFWEKFGISEDWLNFGDIYPISHFFLGNRSFVADKYAYCYAEFKDDKTTFKIYQPYSLFNKWLNNHDRSVWDLWNKLPNNGDKLIITSSRKDALSIWASTGIPSTSLQGEAYIPKENVLNELKNRFKSIYVLYDNDFDKKQNYGRDFGSKLANTFDLKQIEIPEFYGVKDSSDFIKKYNKEKFKNLIIHLT